MIDESVFQTALDDNPDNHGLRLVFADWLAEQGDDRCDGYRWLGENQKRPVTPANRWWFFDEKKAAFRQNYNSYDSIPEKIFDAMVPVDGYMPGTMILMYPKSNKQGGCALIEYPTRQAAENAFAAAFLAVQREEAAERKELAEMEERLQRNCCKCDGGGTICGYCRDERDVVALRKTLATTSG